MKTRLLIAAAGSGRRLGLDIPKALVQVAGIPMIVRTLQRFEALELVDRAVVVVPRTHVDEFAAVLNERWPGDSLDIIEGGPRRQVSVSLGLNQLDEDTEFVLIHDAARPFVSASTIQAVRDSTAEFGAATAAVPCSDTILVGDGEGFLRQTPARERLWSCQTPQGFRVDLIRSAHKNAAAQGVEVTDDASLVRLAGGVVKLVPGSANNLKVTSLDDLKLAELMVEGGLV